MIKDDWKSEQATSVNIKFRQQFPVRHLSILNWNGVFGFRSNAVMGK